MLNIYINPTVKKQKRPFSSHLAIKKEFVPSPRQREQLGGALQYKEPNGIDVKDQNALLF